MANKRIFKLNKLILKLRVRTLMFTKQILSSKKGIHKVYFKYAFLWKKEHWIWWRIMNESCIWEFTLSYSLVISSRRKFRENLRFPCNLNVSEPMKDNSSSVPKNCTRTGIDSNILVALPDRKGDCSKQTFAILVATHRQPDPPKYFARWSRSFQLFLSGSKLMNFSW